MATDSSADKRGLRSSGKKRQTTRHAEKPTPATSPVPGAFGKEGPDDERERTIGEERAEDEGSSSH
jgi:hypothetical protein